MLNVKCKCKMNIAFSSSCKIPEALRVFLDLWLDYKCQTICSHQHTHTPMGYLQINAR